MENIFLIPPSINGRLKNFKFGFTGESGVISKIIGGKPLVGMENNWGMHVIANIEF